ncbi:hypothetical protein BGZ74_000893 [Mortierella antarctica]|nr:hypothetical protein BGZ74_000893 [Mortierella antarctica]
MQSLETLALYDLSPGYAKMLLEQLPGSIRHVYCWIEGHSEPLNDDLTAALRAYEPHNDDLAAAPRDRHALESLTIFGPSPSVAEYVLLEFLDTCSTRLKYFDVHYRVYCNDNINRALSRLGVEVITTLDVSLLPQLFKSTDSEIAEVLVSYD